MPGSYEDADLIERIARDRDQEAFDELYRRYEAPAFKLGRYLTGSMDSSEEAVQETMLQIWRSARTFKPGPAKGWILRILANKCRELLNRKGSLSRREEPLSEHEKSEVQVDCCAPDAGLERGELLGVLNQSLERLSFDERELVALYYGMNLTAEEIAKSLKVPQNSSTVSRRLRKAVETLRANLLQAGYAVRGPLASANGSYPAQTATWKPLRPPHSLVGLQAFPESAAPA